MSPVVRNSLAVIAGIIALALTKYMALKLGNAIIPPPAGADLSTLEGFSAAIPYYQVRHWLPAFFEHAAGSLAGGAATAALAASHRMTLALGIGALHLAGGVTAAFLLPIPVWVVVVDVLTMYLPMAWVGGRLGASSGRRSL